MDVDDSRQTSNGVQHVTVTLEMSALNSNPPALDSNPRSNPLRGPLQYGDVVLLRLCSGRLICSHENLQESSSLIKLEVLDVLGGFSSHAYVSDIKMLSFEIQPMINNQLTGDISYGSEIKLMHVNSKKFITLGRGDIHLVATDFQTDSTETESDRDTMDRLVTLSDDSEDCKLKILNPQDVQDTNQVLANDHQVMFQAQDLYILKWNMTIKELVWHKILNPKFASPASYCTIQLHYHTPYKKFISKLSGSSHLKKRLQETLRRDRKNPLIATINDFLIAKNFTYEVLDQLSFLCEDQNIVMQNYLREQPCDSINLVEIISRLFHERFTNDTIKAKYLDTLIKICVGNFENQQVFVSYKMCKNTMEAINKILRQRQRNDLLQLKASAVSMLEILCEEIHPRTVQNVQRIYAYIDVIALHDTLVECYTFKEYDVAKDTAIKIYNLLLHMEDFKGVNCKTVPSKHQTKQKLLMKGRDEISEVDLYYLVDDDDNQKINKWKRPFCREEILQDEDIKKYRQKAWNYCIKWSRRLEILYKNGKIASRVYFRLHPEDEMTKKEECIVKHAVNCGAPKQRLKQFLVGMKSIEHKVHPLKDIFQRRCCPRRTRFVACSELLNYVLTFWTVVMNILLLVAWESVDLKMEYVYSSPDAVSTANESLLNGYCVDAVCYNNSVNSSLFTPEDCNCSLCVSQTLFPSVPDITNPPHWFFNRTLYFCGAIHSILSLLMALSYFIRYTPDVKLPEPKEEFDNLLLFMLNKDKPPDHFEKKIPSYFRIPLRTFLFESLYVIGFVICSGLSLWLYGYFYPVCLVHIVAGNAVLRRILKSITKNSLKLFLIVVLALGVIFIYSVAAFAFFANEFDNIDTHQYCKSVLQCYITIIHFILIHRDSNFPTNFADFALRVIIFDVSFYVILIVIGISTVSAIVTSTFIELREEWWQIERDRKQICFICQRFSSTFEKKAQGFDHHIFNDHYMFNYVYYKLHIDRVDKDKRNAMEKYYHEMIEAESTDIFPLRVPRCITDSEVVNRCTCHRHTHTDAQMDS